MRGMLAATILAAAMVSGAWAAPETQPLTLDLRSAAELALRKNPNLAGAEAEADTARAAAGKARSALYPTLNLSSSYGYVSEETVFAGVPVLETNTVVNRAAVQQIVYSGGRIQAGVQQARHGYQATRYAAEAARADVLNNVATAYFRAWQAREGIAVAEATVTSLEASHDAARKLFESGVVTRTDVLRSEVALTSARASVISARNTYGTTLAVLKTTVGLPQSTPIELGPASETLDQAVDARPGVRAEVAAASEAVKAAEAARKAARAGRLPTALLVADFQNEPVGSEFPRRSNTLGAGILVSMNVFDGGLTRASIDEATSAETRAREDLAAVQQAVELQAETARLDLDSALARLQTTSTQTASAEESLRALRAGYNEGITQLTDVLAAEAALTEARAMRLSAVYDVKIAQTNLLRALGRTDVLLGSGGIQDDSRADA